MTSVALPSVRTAVQDYRTPFIDGLFLTTVATVTLAKIQWEVAGTVSFSDVITAFFLAAFAWTRYERGDGRLPRAAAITAAFFAAFLIVYFIGFFNMETSQALAQWAKGMFKFVLHFLFLIAGIALVAQRGQRFYWLTLGFFSCGLALNGLYGLMQLVYAETTGGNFDALFIQPITGGDSQINIYGAIEGQNVFRVNALTGDPNHLGIELSVPILILLPIYLRMESGNPWRRRILGLLAFLAVVQLATLSRSGILGLACGLLVLAIPYHRLLLSARFLVPLGLLSAGVVLFASRRSAFFEQVIKSRFATEGKGTSTHIVVYDFIPQVLSTNPFFGLGLNNFSVYYEFVTGRTNFGPHSFYVALFVESGIVGAALFGVFLVYLFRRAGDTRRLGKRLAALGDPLAIRVRPLGWGLTAALVATMVSNIFYLTMTFYYFFVVALLTIVPPVVFSTSRRERQ